MIKLKTGTAVLLLRSQRKWGGCWMSNKEHQNEILSTSLKSKTQEEGLEISSTGYGYESVTKNQESSLDKEHPSCGGL